MATPSEAHEAIITEVIYQFESYLRDKPCKVYGSNFGLNLKDYIPVLKQNESFQKYFKKKIEEGKSDEAFLLPDVSIHCRVDRKSTPRGYPRVPKMVLEVSSPSTNDRDFEEKKDIYELLGVKEYWIICDIQNVSVYILQDDKFVKTKYSVEEREDVLEVPVSVFPNLIIKFDRNIIFR